MNQSQDRNPGRGHSINQSVRPDEQLASGLVAKFGDYLTSFSVFRKRGSSSLDLLHKRGSVGT